MIGPATIAAEIARTAAALHALARAMELEVVSPSRDAVCVYGQKLVEADQRALVEGIQPGTVEQSGPSRWLFTGTLFGRVLVKVYLPVDGVGAELAEQVRSR